MKTTDILKEIQRLPISKRIYLIEKAIRSIRKQENSQELEKAAEELHNLYESDKELTVLTDIDFEEFYETR
jgi:hypothetical protein